VKGAPQKPMTGKLVAEVLAHQLHRFGNVAEVGGAIGAQVGNVFGRAHGLFDLRTFAGGEVKGQPHDFEGKKKIGEDDGRIDFKDLGSFNGDLGRDLRLLADLDQGILLADGAVLRHVASPAWRMNQTWGAFFIHVG
jgi:hypothetical protein